MKINFTILLCLLISGFSLNAQFTEEESRTIDSLKAVANGNEPDSLRLDALFEWDNIIYAYDSDLDLQLNNRILEICDKGLTKSNSTNHEKLIYLRSRGMACNNIGLVYVDYGNYMEALQNFQTSLQIAEYLKDSAKMGSVHNNIGMIYKYLDLPEKALEYYNASITFGDENPYDLGTYYNNVGICYLDMGKTDLALNCYRKSLVYSDSINDYVGKGNTLANIGVIFMRANEYDSAIFYMNLALESYTKVGLNDGMAFATKNIGETYYDMGNYQQAMSFCEKGLVLAYESKSLPAQKESCDCLYRVNKKLGKTSEALRYHELYVTYRDSLQGITKNEEILKLDFQFNLDRQRLKDSLDFASQQRIDRLQYQTTLDKKQNTQYALFAGIGVCFVIGGLMFRGYIRKKRDNETIARQKNEVENQKHIVEEKNKEITDSINYAKRIQEAILPSDESLKKALPESFILYKPKDIVAGDFYWLEEKDNQIFFSVADCTGHGVPGAMVSVVCHNALNRSVNEFRLTDPGKILDKTRELVVETFESESAQNKTSGTIRDGMDISLCVLNKENKELLFAGANNSLFLIRKGELFETRADKQPIGKYADEKPFTSTKINLEQGDILYLYTDGYADQFGGKEGKKFKYKQLKELLIKNSKRTLSDQAKVLEETFENWKGNLEQIDDVCLMGVMI